MSNVLLDNLINLKDEYGMIQLSIALQYILYSQINIQQVAICNSLRFGTFVEYFWISKIS